MADMTRLLLLLLAGLSVSSAVSLEKRMYGGEVCGEKDRLCHVALVENDFIFCGGSLIHKDWVLTAAHCWKDGMKVILGVHPHRNKGTTVKITEHHIRNIDGKDHDIMLLKLEDTKHSITPVPLPDCDNKPKIDAGVQIAGLGSTSNDREVNIKTDALQCADMKLADCKPLKDHLERDENAFWQARKHRLVLCCKSDEKDVCPGDSGGGVVFNGMIYGVNSYISKLNACSYPAAFSDACEYLTWIKETMDVTVPAGGVPVASGSKAG